MKSKLTYGEYVCTREGDRLSTLAAGQHMSFAEKILWSEQCESMAATAEEARSQTLMRSLAVWLDTDSNSSPL